MDPNKQLSIYHGVIDYLNLRAGRRYKVTAKHRSFITARLNEGYQYEDFTAVIDNMVREWLEDPVMYKYLRPETLFGNKFDGYLNLPPAPASKSKAQERRDVGEEWLKESEANEKNGISAGSKSFLELRGNQRG